MDFWIISACLCAAAVSAFSDLEHPKAENIHWESVDFKTVLRWSATPSNYTFSVMFSEEGGDWLTVPDCTDIAEMECDLTQDVRYYDRSFTADIITEITDNDDPEELPHTYSTVFNPYRQSELSAVSFSIQKVAERTVTLNISDPLTGIHIRDKQLTIRDILKKDLKYKVVYYKSGSTGRRELVVDSNLPQIPNLDQGQSYCFMVAAYVPTREERVRQGPWSHQTCTSGSNPLDEVDMGTVFQAIFIPLVLLIIVVTVGAIYCRFCSRKRTNTSSGSGNGGSQAATAQYTVV